MNIENRTFSNYSVFSLNERVGFIFKKSITGQSLFVAVLFLILFISGSAIDGTLIMKGKDVGFLEHPTIWSFLLIQVLSPYYLQKSTKKLFMFLKENNVIDSKKDLSIYLTFLDRQLTRKTNFSVATFVFCSTVGVVAFAWNSFQNQAPLKFLGFDFWDSFNHQFGYWLTRVYKLYLWGFFLPAIAHFYILLLLTLRKILKDSEKENTFLLRPYNQDEHAGVGVVINIAITPFIPISLIGMISLVCAVFVHGGLGITPIVGACILSILFVITYLIPALQLRKIIKVEKKKQLSEIASKQNLLYYELVKNFRPDNESNKLENLNSLVLVFEQVKSISVWPYWKSILKILSITNVPLILSTSKALIPLIKRLIQQG